MESVIPADLSLDNSTENSDKKDDANPGEPNIFTDKSLEPSGDIHSSIEEPTNLGHTESLHHHTSVYIEGTSQNTGIVNE